MTQNFNKAWKSIIAPEKFKYRIQLLQPNFVNYNGRIVERIDITAVAQDNLYLSGVILKQKNVSAKDTILYLHGNGGTKLQALIFSPLICETNVNIISFDFAGCGNSSDAYLTYGNKQVDHINLILEEAKKYIQINRLTLWGRSMGAINAIMYAQKHNTQIHGLILDSPFRKLENIVKRIIKLEIQLPDPIIYLLFILIKKRIQTQLNFQLFEIDYLQHFKKIPKSIPVLFFHSQEDEIVSTEEVRAFYNNARGQRQISQISSKHQQQRSQTVLIQGINWLKQFRVKQKGLKLQLSIYGESSQIQPSKSFFYLC